MPERDQPGLHRSRTRGSLVLPAMVWPRQRPTMLRGTALLPALALTVVAVVQWLLAWLVPVSPWIGGGFGMFATVDGRHRVVTVDGLPVAGANASEYAAAPFDASQGGIEEADPGSMVEVWAPRYHPASGRLTFEVIASDRAR